MDMAEVEESLFAISDAKVHGGMCKILSNIYCKVMNIFPALEAARPRGRSGIQALCSLHVALEKAKNILQHCSESSKLYLAITGDSVLLKFEKAKCGLVDSLRCVEDIVPQSTRSQVQEIVCELEGTVLSLDPLEKQVGNDIIALLQQGRKFDESCNENSDLESFHKATSKLGINSSRAALAERRALKKLIERARMEEDKRKESIVAYLLHLMRKYSKLFRSDLTDDNDSLGSTPCSPTVQGSLGDGNGCRSNKKAFDQQFSKINSFNFRPSFSFRPNDRRSGNMPIPPEELKCPISLQLMYDPVIIASGQTYERACIEKWFNDGHNTCPKTQQQLPHLCLTPNYCVKGLITSWCEQHGIPVPDGPPDSLDFNYWRLALSDSESAKSRSIDSSNSGKLKGVKVVPLEESDAIEDDDGNGVESGPTEEDGSDINVFERCENFLAVLGGKEDLRKKCKVAEQIRQLLRNDEEARMFMGAHGFVEALVQFLKSALHESDVVAQEVGAMALFNLAVNNNRNKELMLAAGVISLLEELMSNPDCHGLAAALYLNLSCLEEAKPIIGSGEAVPFLVKLLLSKADPQCKLDSLHALFNLSTYPSNIAHLIQSGVINGLHSILKEPHNHTWTEKSIAVLINLALTNNGRDAIVAAPGLVIELAAILDNGEPIEQEQAASCLLILCNGNEKCSQTVLQEGVIPSLVSISVNGTARGRDKAQKLLMLFRDQRQRDPAPQPQPEHQPSLHTSEKTMLPSAPKPLSKSVPLNTRKTKPDLEPKPLIKTFSNRKLGKTFTLFRKNKTYSEHH
ncbi:U-box domain-containing protein 45, variant 2 [Ancistrocladus abbreviatus]